MAWAAAWLVWHLTPAPWDLPLSAVPVAAAVVWCSGRTRRVVLVLGWGLSWWLLVGHERWPAWVWLAALAVLLLAYPLSAWRDAPLFPTPTGALDRLSEHLRLAADARLLDAGCGTGAGLQALRTAFPHATIVGIERSAPLVFWARWRCPWAVILHGDIWRCSWSGYSLVYLFQRPESMSRAWEKARQDMVDGGWLVSLEFPVEGRRPHATWTLPGDRRVWVYRIGASSRRTRLPIEQPSR